MSERCDGAPGWRQRSAEWPKFVFPNRFRPAVVPTQPADAAGGAFRYRLNAGDDQMRPGADRQEDLAREEDLAADEREVGEKAGSLQADARSDADLRASRRKADQEERARQVEQRVADENARRKAMRPSKRPSPRSPRRPRRRAALPRGSKASDHRRPRIAVAHQAAAPECLETGATSIDLRST
jgi:hypothetical protein